MELHHTELQTAGLQLLAVRLGEAKHAERYCGKLAPSLTCFAATTNDPYYTWGLHQASAADMRTHGFDILKASAKALFNGQIQGAATGDVAMLTGTFIVDQDGIIRYAYYSEYVGDDPAIDVLVKQAETLRKSSAY